MGQLLQLVVAAAAEVTAQTDPQELPVQVDSTMEELVVLQMEMELVVAVALEMRLLLAPAMEATEVTLLLEQLVQVVLIMHLTLVEWEAHSEQPRALEVQATLPVVVVVVVDQAETEATTAAAQGEPDRL